MALLAPVITRAPASTATAPLAVRLPHFQEVDLTLERSHSCKGLSSCIAAASLIFGVCRSHQQRGCRGQVARHATKNRPPVNFLVPHADAFPKGPASVQVAQLLTWASKQESLIVNPALKAQGSSLAASKDIGKGEPLIGVSGELFLDAAGREDASWQKVHSLAAEEHPDWWGLQMGLRLIQEGRNASTKCWQMYILCLDPLPAAPLLWSYQQAKELNYGPTLKALGRKLTGVLYFHSDHVFAELHGADIEPPSALDLAHAVATAESRAVEVSPGRHVLLPLIDLVRPPEGLASPGSLPPLPNCSLEVETAGDRSFAVLSASREIRAGELLCREITASADELILQHGFASSGRQEDVQIYARLSKDTATNWQIDTIRAAIDLEEDGGGGWLVTGKVRRKATVEQAFDSELLFAARTLACKSRQEWEMPLTVLNKQALPEGFKGLNTKQRRAAYTILRQAVSATLESFDTSPERDEELLQSETDPNTHTAVMFRLEKKRLLKDVLQLLEEADDKVVGKSLRRSKEANLPAAVTGRRSSSAATGFG